MPVLFVLCDKDLRPSNRDCLPAALEECGETLPVSEYSYIVKSNRSADQVYATLRNRIGNRSIWVFTVPDPYTGQAPASVKQWLEEVRGSYVASRGSASRG